MSARIDSAVQYLRDRGFTVVGVTEPENGTDGEIDLGDGIHIQVASEHLMPYYVVVVLINEEFTFYDAHERIEGVLTDLFNARKEVKRAKPDGN